MKGRTCSRLNKSKAPRVLMMRGAFLLELLPLLTSKTTDSGIVLGNAMLRKMFY